MNDLNRKIAPLRPAVNSVLLDTSYLDIEQTFKAIKRIFN
jgi:cytidylate kinase